MELLIAGLKWLGFSTATATVVASYVISTVVSYGISYVAQKLGEDGSDDASRSFERGLKLNKIDPVAPIPVVYGRRLVGGAITYRGLSPDNQVLYQAMVLSEGQIEEVKTVYVNDIPLATEVELADPLEPRTDLENYSYGQTTKTLIGKLKKDAQNRLSKVTWEIKDGREGQIASTLLQGGTNISQQHKGVDTAYIAMAITFSRDYFPSGVPQVTCDVKGVKMYDPRKDNTTTYTSDTTHTHRFNERNTYEWSDNPALCILDYLSNKRYGCGIELINIDLDSFVSSANYCDTIDTVKDYEGRDYNQKKYTCNGVINTDATCLENLNQLLTCCRGMLVFTNGIYKLKIDKPEASTTFDFTEDNILGDWTISGASKRSIANRVTARFFSNHNRFIETLSVSKSDTFFEQDNNVEHPMEIKLPFTAQPQRADYIVQQQLKQSRQGWSVNFKASLDALQCECGDVVSITNSQTGFNQKKFRIHSMTLGNDDTITIGANEYDGSVYTYDLNTLPYEPETDIPGGFTPTEILNLTVNSGTDYLVKNSDGSITTRAFIDWTEPERGFVRSYEVGYKQTSEAESSYTEVSTPLTQYYASPLLDNVNYDFRVRAVSVSGEVGEYVYLLNVLIEGKSQKPSDVPTFYFNMNKKYQQVFRWEEITDIDLRGYRIRYSKTSNVWENMSALHNGVLTSNPYETNTLAEGTYYFAIKAVDTSNLESENALVISGEVEDDPAVNIFMSKFPHLDNWTADGTTEVFSAQLYNGFIENNKLYSVSERTWANVAEDTYYDASFDNIFVSSEKWENWTKWNPEARPLVYSYIMDLGSEKVVTPIVTASGSGTILTRVSARTNNTASELYPESFTLGSYPAYNRYSVSAEGTAYYQATDEYGNNYQLTYNEATQTWSWYDPTGGLYTSKDEYYFAPHVGQLFDFNDSVNPADDDKRVAVGDFIVPSETSFYVPTDPNKTTLLGRYVHVMIIVEGTSPRLDSLSILLDGFTYEEVHEFDTSSSIAGRWHKDSTGDGYFKTDRAFGKITSVHVQSVGTDGRVQVLSSNAGNGEVEASGIHLKQIDKDGNVADGVINVRVKGY